MRNSKNEYIEALQLWVLSTRLQDALEREEFSALDSMSRMLLIRNGLLANMVAACRQNARLDSRLAIMALISYNADNDKFCCSLTIKRIAQIVGREERNVREAINWLCESGFICVDRTENGLPNTYWPRISPELLNSKASITWFSDAFSAAPRPVGRPKNTGDMNATGGSEKTPDGYEHACAYGAKKTPDVVEQNPGCSGTNTPDVEEHSNSLMNPLMSSLGGNAEAIASAATALQGLSDVVKGEAPSQANAFKIQQSGKGSVAKNDGRATTRIPDDWKPSEQHYVWGKRHHLEAYAVDHAAEMFLNHWSTATRNAKKLDWNKAFTNWLGRDLNKLQHMKRPNVELPATAASLTQQERVFVREWCEYLRSGVLGKYSMLMQQYSSKELVPQFIKDAAAAMNGMGVAA